MKKNEQGITQQVLSAYNRIGSVKGTAKECQICWQRVVKILSSNDVVSSDTHRKILNLYHEEKTPEEIAKSIGLAISTVRAYLPAVRPIYNENPSQNAKRIKQWRSRKKER